MTLLYLVAGETSGDAIGARLMAALERARPELDFAGIGGPAMAARGLDSLFPMRELALIGLVEVLPRLISLRRRLAETAADIAARRPDAVITIDSPGFALRLLRQIAPLGIPRIHYVAPQAWAWREGRVKSFSRLFERLLCLLPFETEFFLGRGVAASFVGHPVLESGADEGDAERFRTRFEIPPTAHVLLMLPGSRRSEIGRLLPLYGRALELIGERVRGLVAVIPLAPDLVSFAEPLLARWPARPILVANLEAKHDAYAAATAALTKSGTSTLEMALAGVPMVVTYRVNPLTALLARRLIRVPHAAMVNLLAGEEVVPELLQEQATPENIASALDRLIEGEAAARAQRAHFPAILSRLRPDTGRPSEAAACAVLELLDKT